MTADQVLREKMQPLLETGKTVSGAEEERETDREGFPFLYTPFSPIWFNALVKRAREMEFAEGRG